MKTAVVFGIVVLLAFLGIYFLTKQNAQNSPEVANFLTPSQSPTVQVNTPTPAPTIPEAQRISGKSAVIRTAKGNIEVELVASQAAKTVMNFATPRGFSLFQKFDPQNMNYKYLIGQVTKR